MIGPVTLYPRWWRDRYADEMAALLDAAPHRRRDTVDLARGALDAWLHPPMPSRLPIAAALVGGGLWTFAAAWLLRQPVQADWPGYLVEVVPLAVLVATCLLVATLAIALRAADAGGWAVRLAAFVAVAGYVAWVSALAATQAGVADPATLGIGQTLAMGGMAAVGLVVLRVRAETVGFLVLLAAVIMVIPSTTAWLAFGATWTVIGVVLAVERVGRSNERRMLL